MCTGWLHSPKYFLRNDEGIHSRSRRRGLRKTERFPRSHRYYDALYGSSSIPMLRCERNLPIVSRKSFFLDEISKFCSKKASKKPENHFENSVKMKNSDVLKNFGFQTSQDTSVQKDQRGNPCSFEVLHIFD